MGFREKLARFFYGRYITYGFDQFGIMLLIVCITLSVLNLFLGSIVIQLLEYFILGFCFFRLFSKNIAARQRENAKFIGIKGRFTGFFKNKKRRFDDRHTHVYKKCPSCKATLRLPKKRGQHTVCCPKCSNNFKVRVR